MSSNRARLGFLIIIFGVMVAGSTIASDSASWPLMRTSFDLPAKGQIGETTYPIRRTTRVIVQSSVDFEGKLYILDEACIRRWLEEDVFDPLVTVDVHGGVSTTFEPPIRGLYGFLVYNDLNETREVSLSASEYGLEYDVLSASGVIVLVGTILTMLEVMIKALAPQKCRTHR